MFAEGGLKVLVINCDFRRPRIHKYLLEQDGPGTEPVDPPVFSDDPATVARLKRRDNSDVLGELNIKEIAVSSDDSALVDLGARPNLKVLGKKLGPKMKAVTAGLQGLTQADLRAFVASGSLTIEGETLGADDVLLVRAPKPGLVVASEGALTVALDTVVTEELRLEGLAREIVNRVQNLRKTADLDVSTRVRVTLRCGGALAAAAAAWGEMIRGETLASTLEIVAPEHKTGPQLAEDEIDGETLGLGLVPATETT